MSQHPKNQAKPRTFERAVSAITKMSIAFLLALYCKYLVLFEYGRQSLVIAILIGFETSPSLPDFKTSPPFRTHLNPLYCIMKLWLSFATDRDVDMLHTVAIASEPRAFH